MLRVGPGEITKFLRSRRLLRRETFAARKAVHWTTARGVTLSVAHFRALLGKTYEQGQDRLRTLDRMLELALLKKAG